MADVKDCPYQYSADILCDNSMQWPDIEYFDAYTFWMYIFSQSNLHVYTLPIDVGSIMLFLCFEIHHIRVILRASSATQRCIQNPVKHLIFNTAQKMKFSIKDFFSKCDQIRRFFFCAV